PGQAVIVQTAEVEPLLEVDLRMARRLERAIPFVMRIDRFRPDDFRFVASFGFFRHASSASASSSWNAISTVECRPHASSASYDDHRNTARYASASLRRLAIPGRSRFAGPSSVGSRR